MLLSVNTKDRISGNSTDCKILLLLPVSVPKKIELLSVTIPNTIYNVTSTNNMVYWTDTVSHSTQLPTGSYSISTLISTIQTQMNAAYNNNYALSYSSTTFKVTITGTTAFTLDFMQSNNCGTLLGFNQLLYPANTTFTSDNAISMSPNTELFLVIPELDAINKTIKNKQFTFHIPFNAGVGDVIQLDQNQLNNQQILYNYPRQLYQLSVYLNDVNNNSVSLNGNDFSFVLKIS